MWWSFLLLALTRAGCWAIEGGYFNAFFGRVRMHIDHFLSSCCLCHSYQSFLWLNILIPLFYRFGYPDSAAKVKQIIDMTKRIFKKNGTYAVVHAISYSPMRQCFLTPVYSSTVFVEIVVVTFAVSFTCVYVAVELIVRHALQLVKAMTHTPIRSIIKIFLIV